VVFVVLFVLPVLPVDNTAGTFGNVVPAVIVFAAVVVSVLLRFKRCSCKRLTQSKSPSLIRLFSLSAL